LDFHSPTHTSCIAGITDVWHHIQFIFWDGVSLIYTVIFLISAFWVAGIMGESHCAWPGIFFIFQVLRLELRALHLLGRHFTIWAIPPAELYLMVLLPLFRDAYKTGFLFFVCFWWDWSLNLRLCPCKSGALPLEPSLQSIFFWLFWRWGSHKLFVQAGLELWSSRF
jgi:hypothetical protein